MKFTLDIYKYILFFFLELKNFYLFLAALGLRRCSTFFSSCGVWGLLSSCGEWASHCGGFSCRGAPALGLPALVVVVPGFTCPAACGIFPDQGSNPCPLHWQVDSWPLDH